MPFVNIRILKGHSQQRKDEMSRRVTAAISEIAELPNEAIWVVFEDVTADDWYVGAARVSELQKAAAAGKAGDMSVEIRHPAFESVVGPSVEFEKLGTGFLFTEGPLWNAAGKYLLFSDMPGDRIRRWSADGGVVEFRNPSNKSNGLTWDREGRLLACEHATSRVTRTEPDGHITVLASHYEGKELNSPNDIVVKRDGAIYFTDPTYGRIEFYGVPRPTELGFRGVYRLDPDTEDIDAARRRLQAAERPLLLARRETSVRERHRTRSHPHVRRSARRHAGSRPRLGGNHGRGSGRARWHEDRQRRQRLLLWPGRHPRLRSMGTCLGVIKVPEAAANFDWGDADNRSLFITASTSLYRVRVGVPGR